MDNREPTGKLVDLVIRSARVADGNAESVSAARQDIAIDQERIIAIEPNLPLKGKHEIEAENCFALPGFIDVHAHSDESVLLPCGVTKVLQGVTTEICGQCGGSPAPQSVLQTHRVREAVKREEDYWYPEERWESFEDYFQLLERQGTAANHSLFAGWWSVLDDQRFQGVQDPFEGAINALKTAAREGVSGLSINQESETWTGLSDAERHLLFEAAAELGLLVSIHLASYESHFLDHFSDACALSEHTGATVQVSHIKFMGSNRDRLREGFFRMIDIAMKTDLVGFDVVPFESICTRLHSFVARVEAQAGYLDTFNKVRGMGREWELLKQDGWTPETLARLRVLNEADEGECVEAFGIDEHDINALLLDRRSFVGSDASVTNLAERDGQRFHRRTFDTFPTALERFHNHGLNVAEIARKIAAAPADRFSIGDRGRLLPGWYADVVIFEADPKAPERMSSYQPRDVIVNGAHVVQNGKAVKTHHGRPLYPPVGDRV